MALSIHPGAHKTASTHLQYSLRQVRDRLRAAGLAYLGPDLLRGQPLALSMILAQGLGGRDEAAARQAFRDMRGDCPDMLISEENILGLTHRTRLYSRRGEFYPRAATRLRHVIALADAGPAVLYLALRDPATFVVSAFGLQVAEGKEIDLEDYLCGRDPARSDWAGLVGRLAAVDNLSRIVLWRYEDYPALRPRLLERLLPQGLAAEVPDSPPANVGLTQPGYDWLLRRAAAFPEADIRLLVRRARQRFHPADGHAPLRPLDEATYARSARNYARDIEALRAMPRVEFLAP
ncbi:hypothetical protein [Paracoccus thiocyanatus]|uniref:Sulfotransferase family protein n=1 Tax=Paracoccus thiocyanatus TaxID=34006 RepID=A0A3D8PI01_9RHOB|nr:hypothetical protein [Paracoccus thiocyanatus]RDW14861.1 hypothetical protein DIE28_00030 [Paracoccus thiocyanatus]